MSIPSSVKRQLAEECFLFAMKGDFEQAARIRQQAYTASPPGSIGLDWSSWNEVWGKDSRYIKFLLNEDFSDCDNSQAKIHSIQAGIFIDYLFDFRDCWGVKQQALINNETFQSKSLDIFLKNNQWEFRSDNREIIYTNTKKKNISAKIYYSSINESGLADSAHPQIFEHGEYDLGFLPGTPQRIIDARRKWLETYDLFLQMSDAGIEKFPKTYRTFEKHYLSNSKKYQEWLRQYTDLTQK